MSGEKNLHVLFEHASGFSAFKVKEFEEESMFVAEVEECIRDYSRFTAVTQLVSFHPFKTAQGALENLNAITEGIIPDDLKTFLVQLGVKKLCLGVAEGKLASSISEVFPKIKIKVGPVIQELCRGIRTHFYKMIKGLTAEAGGKAQLGLGHSYSRARVKFNVNRQDNMIIQGIALLDQLDKDVNTFSMRIREWYSYHFPELVKIVPDNYMYARAVHIIKNRKELTEEKLEALTEITGDDGKAQAIVDASKSSMGMDISPIDLINIEAFSVRVIKLAEYRKGLLSYLQSKMNTVAPNLTSLIGETVAARLISHAGSLTNLAKFPASTVQILGAEKALFRALKTRGKTPKYGLLFHSTFIGRAGAVHKGRISRFLANKCSIASRLDCFSEFPNSVFGEHLRGQVEERLKFFESGDVPRKNVDVMKEALDESNLLTVSMLANAGNNTTMEDGDEGGKKKKKKKKKGQAEVSEVKTEEDDDMNGNGTLDQSKKKKKKKVKQEEDADESALAETETVTEIVEKGKKKKKRKSAAVDEDEEDEGETLIKVKVEEDSPKKKKKKMK